MLTLLCISQKCQDTKLCQSAVQPNRSNMCPGHQQRPSKCVVLHIMHSMGHATSTLQHDIQVWYKPVLAAPKLKFLTAIVQTVCTYTPPCT